MRRNRRRRPIRRSLLAVLGAALAWAPPAIAGPTFDGVKARGQVVCGVNTGVAGFSAPDARGGYQGLDAEFCRAIAAAMFGDATKVRFVPTTHQTRFVALQSGEVDVLARNVTQTLTRDTNLGFNFAGVNFYDGQGFMVRRAANVTAGRASASTPSSTAPSRRCCRPTIPAAATRSRPTPRSSPRCASRRSAATRPTTSSWPSGSARSRSARSSRPATLR